MAMPRKSRIGEKKGKLKLIEWGKGSRIGVFMCDCGNETEQNVVAWRMGRTTSCGCGRRGENSARFIHGFSKSSLSNVLTLMKRRCTDPKDKFFHIYGGRGITVCKEWIESNGLFFNWAMSNGYEKGLCIDRIDNNKGYSPDNCRWTTNKINCNNRNNNRRIEFNGETHTLSEWAEILNIKRSTLSGRINTFHWPIEKALTKVNQK